MNEEKREQKLCTPGAICQFHKAGTALSEQTFIVRSPTQQNNVRRTLADNPDNVSR